MSRNGSPTSWADLFHERPGVGAGPGMLRQRALEETILNAMSTRTELYRKFLDPRRSIDDDCGYPGLNTVVTADYYQQLYDREAVANTVVRWLPAECWSVLPDVYEDEDPAVETPFEESFKSLNTALRGQRSWANTAGAHALWEYVARVDEVSGIGHYGVLLLGFDDRPDGDLSQPVTPSPGRRLLFLRAFPEVLAQITRFETDDSSQRFGEPVEYLLTFNDPREGQTGGIGVTTVSKRVHWSRVIHVADNRWSGEVFGVPRMRPVLNRLLDLRKLYAGCAEMYYRGALPGLAIKTHPNLIPGEVDFNTTATRDQLEQYMNTLQRYLILFGFDVESLAPQVVDPTPQINVQLEAICIQLRAPKRVFMGSERGELASSQDDAKTNERIRARHLGYLSPRLIYPLIDRLIMAGVLKEPGADGYKVHWPDLAAQSEQERAQVGLTLTQALAAYLAAGGEAVVPPLSFLTVFLKRPEEEARTILEEATRYLADHPELQLARTDPSLANPRPLTAADPTTQPGTRLAA